MMLIFLPFFFFFSFENVLFEASMYSIFLSQYLCAIPSLWHYHYLLIRYFSTNGKPFRMKPRPKKWLLSNSSARRRLDELVHVVKWIFDRASKRRIRAMILVYNLKTIHFPFNVDVFGTCEHVYPISFLLFANSLSLFLFSSSFPFCGLLFAS